MDYKLLSSLYYQDKAKYEYIYNNRINSDSTYIFDFNIDKYPAFVVITPEILDKLQLIFELNSKLQSYKRKLPILAINQYSKKCLVDEIKKTNDIENIYSTKKEIKMILNSPQTTKKNRFYGLVKKYEKMTNNEFIPLQTCLDIRNLYDEFALQDVLKDDPDNMPDGKYFRTQGVFVRSSSGKDVHTGIYPESKIIELMDSSLKFLNDEKYNFFIRIAIFHYIFGYIHPFYDGNGRMSRFMSSYLLSQKLDILVALRLSYIIKEKQASYYKMFKISNDKKNKGDLTYFVIKFFEFVIESLQELISALDFKHTQLTYYAKLCSNLANLNDNKLFFSITYILVQNELFEDEDDYIDFKFLKDILNFNNQKIGDSKLRALLKELENINLIITDKSHRFYSYKINLDELEKYN